LRLSRITVLHLVGNGGVGGVETFVANLAQHINRETVALSVCILGSERQLAHKLQELDIALTILNWKNRFDVAAAAKLHSLVRRERIDVVHANTGGRIHRFIVRQAGCRAVVTHLHGIAESKVEAVRKGGSAARPYFSRLVAGSDHLLGCSEWMTSSIRSALPALSKRISTLSCGVDLERFRAGSVPRDMRAELDPGNDRLIVGFVGRLVPQKGLGYLIQLAKLVAHRRPDAMFVVVGDGPLRERYTAAARDASLTNLRFVGEQTDVRVAMSAFDMLVVPSEWEPFGVVTLEAMAMAKPVVAFEVDGIREVVLDNVTGILVPHRNVAALAERVLSLGSNPDLRARFGKAGRQRAEALYDSRDTARLAERLYLGLSR